MSKPKTRAASRLVSAHEFIVITRQDTETTVDVFISDDFKHELVEELQGVVDKLRED